MAVKLSYELLNEVVPKCLSVSEVMRKLGYLGAEGSSHAHVSKRIKSLGINTSHFDPYKRFRALARSQTKAPELILVLGQESNNRTPAHRLRRSLIARGHLYQCYRCNLDEWCGEKLTLDVDHINGKYWDNREENLRFACPNCHSLTPTFKHKGRVRVRTEEEEILRKLRHQEANHRYRENRKISRAKERTKSPRVGLCTIHPKDRGKVRCRTCYLIANPCKPRKTKIQ